MLKKTTIFLLAFLTIAVLADGSNSYAGSREFIEATEKIFETIVEATTEKTEETTESLANKTEETTESLAEKAEGTTEVSTKKAEEKTEVPTEKAEETTKTAEKATEKVKETKPAKKKDFTVKTIDKKTMYATLSLNVRKGPDTSYDTIGSLEKNQTVTVTGTVNDSHWVRVEYNGKTGYASGKYLSDKKSESSTKKETAETKKDTTKTETKKENKSSYTVKAIDKKTMYATTDLNVRKGPGTSYGTIGSLSYAQKVTVTGTVNDSHWVRVEYKGKTGYASGKYLSDKKPAASSNSSSKVSGYPINYSDSTCKITITKEWFENAYVYAAHIKFTDYSRFGTTCGKGKYGGTETTTSAAKRVGALLAVNGCYSAPSLNYPVARSGKVMNDKNCWVPAIYSRWNGKLLSAWETGGTPGIAGVKLSSLVSDKKVSDTFSFGPPILAGGSVKAGSDSSRAQRTFIGTNGDAGDIWLFVSDGRKNDGKSSGHTYKQCARYMQSKGCTFGVPLDGGGSSTMVWKGQVLNAAKGNQRAVVDFVYFK